MRKTFKNFANLLLLSGAFVAGGGANHLRAESPQDAKIAVTGVVSDAEGPIIGAGVVEKGNPGNGVATDVDGKYSLRVSPNATITVSYLGYATQEVSVNGQTTINVTLLQDAKSLDEVVVTALGMTREKKALGYAITELKGDDIIKSNVVNPINGLQGKVAGVQIDMGSAGPQSSQRILIRGNTSMSGNNQPIFVIDGVIVDNEVTKTGDKFERDFGNDLKNLNSDDFESVSVLKGAAATALYGSRASNGVILITTKKGKQGDGLGISFSHTEQWEDVYDFPHLQNEFGMGSLPVWAKNADGTDNRNITAATNFGPRYDGKPYNVDGVYEGINQAYPDNLNDMYRTGRYQNTNVAVSGGSEKSTFRFSYSRLASEGVSLNNSFERNNISLNASHVISKIVSADAGFNYVSSDGRNPTYQGGTYSPVYDFAYSVPRSYDTKYWMQNYWSAKHDGYNDDDPFGYSKTLFELLENNEYQSEQNYRGYLNVNFTITDWLKLAVKGDMNNTSRKYEKKTLAVENSDYRGAAYLLNESTKQQQKYSAMLSASKRFGDFGINGSLGAESFREEQSYHNSQTNNGLRVPGMFTLANSVNAPTTDAYAKIKQKRLNSVYGFVNADWQNQLYLDVTGRNDWSSTLMYANGTGNVSYFYPSVSGSWLITETLRESLPEIISFAKLRASYAVVGKDCDPYLITDPGTYIYYNSFKQNHFDASGTYPYYDFNNRNLGSLDLKPEKQHAVELGFDYKMFDNRLGLDFAWYKTNTYNQILNMPVTTETGVSNRVFNAGNIQNSGIELLVTGTVIKNKDWLWDLTATYTRNRNKIIELAPGVEKYRLGSGGLDVDAWATEGGAYGDLYTSHAYKRDENGNKLLNASGQWLRAGESTKVGSMQPKFLGGLTSSLSWKGVTLSMVVDARVGGDIMSGSYNYGMASGSLAGSLQGRPGYGGLERTLSAANQASYGVTSVQDGMIPDGVFQANTIINGQDVSGMTYQKAYEAGYVQPISAFTYYINKFEWSTGIREASVFDLSWVALREISVYWDLPKAWTSKAFVKGATLGFVVRNVGYLYNSLPDNIHPEGLKSNLSYEFQEAGGSVYSRNYGVKLNLNF
ncbi:SusC/RagA family TonB-linked outer membrane protein [Bacteroidia bacterium]|nr:SusC/RagA family TonB-linked outer membrane protein [Bacteroidia bacterium]